METARGNDEDAALPWRNDGWRKTADEWVKTALATRGVTPTGEMAVFRDALWSLVMRVPTDGGDFYFKAVGPRLRYEARLSDFLFHRFPEECVPIVAFDPERGWLLMPDAGIRLRDAPDFGIEDWYDLMARYAHLQIALIPEADALAAIGTPDRRIASLPSVYAGLIEEALRLCAHTEYRMTTDELERLRALAPVFNAECQELAASGIPDSIDHGDLHDGNVFVKNGFARFADWGDSCVAHPFVSGLVPMNVFIARFDFAPDAPEVSRLRDAYLETFEIFADRKTLLCAFPLARRVAEIFRALSWRNAIGPLSEAARAENSESALYWLRKWATEKY